MPVNVLVFYGCVVLGYGGMIVKEPSGDRAKLKLEGEPEK